MITITWNYLDIDEIQMMKIEPNLLSLFLEYLLKATNKTFDIIAISES